MLAAPWSRCRCRQRHAGIDLEVNGQLDRQGHKAFRDDAKDALLTRRACLAARGWRTAPP